MGLAGDVRLWWKARKLRSEFLKAQKEDGLEKSLRGLGHVLALLAPVVGAYLFEQLGLFLGKSDDHLLQSLGAVLGALVPLMRRLGSSDDRAMVEKPGGA